ncbi:hypothetical protein DFP72DRAFT_919369 [Ephemerocybe angulata]|uniref:Uncharacterized protein n=1 Tax=Ephemerocybe angulata TaxID=980116 RepID=A0A8H6HIJ4_9AGAR|nr:hypothetical protein DFP72DRAFT_919369 [Tulosesus angulatus]
MIAASESYGSPAIIVVMRSSSLPPSTSLDGLSSSGRRRRGAAALDGPGDWRESTSLLLDQLAASLKGIDKVLHNLDVSVAVEDVTALLDGVIRRAGGAPLEAVLELVDKVASGEGIEALDGIGAGNELDVAVGEVTLVVRLVVCVSRSKGSREEGGDNDGLEVEQHLVVEGEFGWL